MQRGLVHAIAWSLATGAAVTLSWWGVHTVMSGTAYDPPRAVPISVGARGGRTTNEPVSSSTHRALPSPSPSPSASASGKATTSAPTPSPRTSRRPSSRPPAASPAGPSRTPAAPGEVKSYPTRGGRVVLELAAGSAKLVSATPEPDWSMQVWTEPQWIRVDFSDGAGATVSVFCTWNGHPPMVETVDR
ncbi:hypothetical protein [Streptomyces sp. NRRL S-4]|uniref:hypothetical protein n=1 Tax=Streptomyces sp. NRRL S-4 TaxID=1519471 RepID=UPI0006B47A71|nr:hypothetical protein [Streptomyces sp. NRRL S-4]KPC85029.1 hypothetical protein ADK82_03180 [Streptomyces sp. NRRL S-4]